MTSMAVRAKLPTKKARNRFGKILLFETCFTLVTNELQFKTKLEVKEYLKQLAITNPTVKFKEQIFFTLEFFDSNGSLPEFYNSLLYRFYPNCKYLITKFF